METGGWGGGVIALCFAFRLLLRGFFGWVVFFLVFVLLRADMGMGEGQMGGGLKDGGEEW